MTQNEKTWLLDRSVRKSAKPKWWQALLVLLGWLSLAVACGGFVGIAVYLVQNP